MNGYPYTGLVAHIPRSYKVQYGLEKTLKERTEEAVTLDLDETSL